MQELEQEMRRLRDEVLNLGHVIEEAIVESVDLFRWRALPTSSSLIILNHQIAKKRFAIELDCVTLLATRQTSDSQLRAIASTLEIVVELERMGNCIAEIAEIHCMVVGVEGALLDLLAGIRHVAVETQDLLRGAMEAFAQQDLALAWAVHAKSQETKALYGQVHREALTFMKGKPRLMIKRARHLSQVARNLACIADRVANICEWIIFVPKGDLVPAPGDLVPAPGDLVPAPGDLVPEQKDFIPAPGDLTDTGDLVEIKNEPMSLYQEVLT